MDTLHCVPEVCKTIFQQSFYAEKEGTLRFFQSTYIKSTCTTQVSTLYLFPFNYIFRGKSLLELWVATFLPD